MQSPSRFLLSLNTKATWLSGLGSDWYDWRLHLCTFGGNASSSHIKCQVTPQGQLHRTHLRTCGTIGTNMLSAGFKNCVAMQLYSWLQVCLLWVLRSTVPRMYVYIDIHPSIHPSIRPSIYVYLYLSISIYIYLYLSISIYVSLSLYLSHLPMQAAKPWTSKAVSSFWRRTRSKCLLAQADVATLHTPPTYPLPRKAMENVTWLPWGPGEVCGLVWRKGKAISEVAKVPRYFDGKK